MIHADAFRAALQELHDAVHEQFFGNDSGLPPRLIKATNEAGCLLSLAQPEPEGPPMFKPDEVHPFVVRHYTDDQRPSIKGNGFDGLEVGEDRQEAEEFIAWINARLCPSRSNLNG